MSSLAERAATLEELPAIPEDERSAPGYVTLLAERRGETVR
ncbi:MAG: hypothetical protein M5U28_31915 [Sandaracinaceae bacterium]|nr:hypothetical protein [Sandaracinaceae bacterium]